MDPLSFPNKLQVFLVEGNHFEQSSCRASENLAQWMARIGASISSSRFKIYKEKFKE